jgi:RNA polymerase sigma factor (sigma-70 family)
MTMKTITLITTTLATYAATTPSTGNDNSTPKRLPVHPAKLLGDREVVLSIEGKLLRMGVDRQDLADGVAEVQKRALENIRRSPMPTDVGGWKALACTIAERMVIKDRKRDEKRSKYNTGLCEDPEEYAELPRSPSKRRDPVDMSRQIAVLKAQFDAGEMPEQGQEILMGVMDDLSAKEIGEELGLSETVVANRLSRMRRLFRLKLASLGMLVLMLLVAALLTAPFGGMATRDTDPPPVPPPIVATTATPHDHGEDAGSDAPPLLEEQDRELEAKPRP